MEFIDTHTHLYSQEFASDITEVMERAEKAGLVKYFLPAIDSSTHEAMIALEMAYPEKCISMMGLHPCSVREDYQKELDLVRSWLDKRAFAAIGEIGLDYYWDKTHIEQQKIAFDQQMQWAFDAELPIVIHARDSLDDCIEMVKPYSVKGLKGIFHCFGGTELQAKAIIEMGFFLGIGGVFTYKKANMPQVLKDISMDHIVLETDSPYLAPVPYRGKRNESGYLLPIATALAEAKGLSLGEVAEITTRNALHIFKSIK